MKSTKQNLFIQQDIVTTFSFSYFWLDSSQYAPSLIFNLKTVWLGFTAWSNSACEEVLLLETLNPNWIMEHLTGPLLTYATIVKKKKI